MRIDKFLKVARIIKPVSVNGRAAKAGTEIKPGDIVEVSFSGNKTKFEILSVSETVRKDDAKDLYRIITD